MYILYLITKEEDLCNHIVDNGGEQKNKIRELILNLQEEFEKINEQTISRELKDKYVI